MGRQGAVKAWWSETELLTLVLHSLQALKRLQMTTEETVGPEELQAAGPNQVWRPGVSGGTTGPIRLVKQGL